MTRAGSRRRLVGLSAGGVLVAVAAIITILIVSSSSATEPPATGAAKIVPADALAYVHVSLDRSRPAVTQGLRLAAGLPNWLAMPDDVVRRLAAMTDVDPDVFLTSARSWIGREAAIALLGGPGSVADTLIVLAVRHPQAAQRFLTQSSPGASGKVRGVSLLSYAGGTYAALLPGYLVLGQRASVIAAIDVASGATPSLAGSPLYQRAAASEPAGRVVDAYAPAGGLTRLLAARTGALSALGTLLDTPGLAALTMSLSPATGGADIQVHSVYTGARGQSRPATFDPTLLSVIPSDVTLLLDGEDLGRLAPRLLAAGAAAGVGGAVAPLLRHLGSALAAEGVNVAGIVSLFHRETAVAVISATSHPALVIVAHTRDAAAARLQLAALEPALEDLFPPATSGPGGAAVFTQHQVAGVNIYQLQLAPGLELDYGVFHQLIVVSTSDSAIAALARGGAPVTANPTYQSVLGSSSGRIGSLVFLDFSQLIRLGVQTGVAHGASFAQLRPDLERIQAIGLRSTGGGNESTSELYLRIP